MSALAPDAGGDDVEALLEGSWDGRTRVLPRRELFFEGGLTAALVVLCLLLLKLDGATPEIGPALLCALGGYLVASRVTYPLGAGDIVPTQPFLVLLFVTAPASVVPLLVWLALAAGTLFDAARGRTPPDRVVFAGGDALHAVGPALVLLIAGVSDASDAGLLLLVAALGAQAACDVLSSLVREWMASGVRPQLQARVMAKVVAVDLALTPLGILAAHHVDGWSWSPLLLLPLVLLLVLLARDRLGAVQRAHRRLVELEKERTRLGLAVRRVGEAFGSNLDLDELLDVVTRTTADALHADSARALIRIGDRVVVHDYDDAADAALVAARDAVLARCEAGEAVARDARADRRALAVRVEDGDVVAVLAIAREGAEFLEGESELAAFLAEKAGVAAGNVLRHETLHHQAVVDELTGLANHRRFQELLAGAVDRCVEEEAPCALVLLDLDNFKSVNDAHGHHFGDTVLRRVAGCLRDHSRQSDEPARYGGEELAVVLCGADEEVARQVAERVRGAVEELVVYAADGQPAPISISVGVSTLAAAGPTRHELFAAADAALYEAKRRGKNRVVVAATGAGRVETVGRRRADAARVLEEMPRALSEDELRLHFQPIVDLRSQRVAAAEALVRWQHPTRGEVGPGDFIPATENEGLMPALGRWVFADACRRARAWHALVPDVAVTVNVSPSQVAQPDFYDDLVGMLGFTGLPPELLIVELTEAALQRDAKRIGEHLAAVREGGVRIALDDFGTGHSGPEHLLSLPLDLVKVPRAFVQRLDHADARERRLCEGLIEVVRGVGIEVVGEGVETAAQRDALSALGVEYAQGFHIAAPMTAEALHAWLASRGAGATTAPRTEPARGPVGS